MLINLHKNATTTPATRLAIQQAHGTETELAQRFGVGSRAESELALARRRPIP